MMPKYRAWDKIEEVMCPVTVISPLGCFLVGNSPTPGRILGEDLWSDGIKEGHFVNYENLVLQQATGLVDKNGKDIYEGDVLRAHGQVIWNDLESRWSCIDLNWNDRKEIHDIHYLTSPYEVIGNIFENKDLCD